MQHCTVKWLKWLYIEGFEKFSVVEAEFKLLTQQIV